MKEYQQSRARLFPCLILGLAPLMVLLFFIDSEPMYWIVAGTTVFIVVLAIWPPKTGVVVDNDGITRYSVFRKRKLAWADIRAISASLGHPVFGGRRGFFIHSKTSPDDDIAFNPRYFRRRDLAELASTIMGMNPRVKTDIQIEILIDKYGRSSSPDLLESK